MSRTVLVATEKPFAKAAVDGIKKVLDDAGYTLSLLENYTDTADLLAAVKTPDAVIIRSDKVTADVIAAAENMKIVVRAGAGFDNVDCDAALKADVVVMNTPGQNSNAVAELAFGMMLNLARNKYTGKAGTELRGKTIGIHAYGNVGKFVAIIAKGFGMTVKAFDPFVEKSAIEAAGVEVVESVETLYSGCDYVSLHIPANDKTKKSIDYELLSSMKEGAALINTARKEVIDEDGLLKAMTEREDLRYGSDLTPDCLDALNAAAGDRVFVTAKKMGAQTAEANINAGIAAAQQIVAFFEKGDTTFKVN
ncbi:MAG: 3-phosphoglycerate dehydrogenase [Deltaproteobacteria bacterium]|nr:3-phosphoglycerate dehydrogenase [Deltaproteobacteria bacterium]MBN2673648.1 3-phosphoglycerate dehydrogenase [Deltaproteobacteria bacterium]